MARSTMRTFFQAVKECAAADPPEISDAQNNRKRCRE
ncbi:BnaCnng75600D [Brassica napus]|uniref:BnaCnng75600D protein n=1 Tax=Brassica napus TaxID=3708 RepID=A0A078K052_BRANA|nr:BnaCnng75600D [Brassica napus]